MQPQQQSVTPEGDSPQSANPRDSPSTPEETAQQSEEGYRSSYPSWLPKRPPPPAPASTFHSSSAIPSNNGEYHDTFDSDAAASRFPIGGRRATPRSVRIVSLQESTGDAYRDRDREPTDQTRVSNNNNAAHARVWSRATSSGISPTAFGPHPLPPRPRFRMPALRLDLLRSPSWLTRLQYYLLPLFVFAHVPVQTFFDFNAVFVLIQVSKFPNPEAPGVPGSGRNWALGAAAYIACWFLWIVVVMIVYELVYCFFRRWRAKRPLVLPIYLSAPAHNFASMTSYSNFCFFRHLRTSAFSDNDGTGSLRDGLAETCYFYAQNFPTVVLLLPRAGLCLALLLTFSSPMPGELALADAGVNQRDSTFFQSDGALTAYARGVLIANAAWTAWRAIVLLTSCLGLWILSEQGCAGLCGPRYRWEEDDAEKNLSVYSEGGSETFAADALLWSWKECTRERVQHAYDFCLVTRPPRSRSQKNKGKEVSDEMDVAVSENLGLGEGFEGMEQVLAAVGFPSSPLPARRGVLSGDLFEVPKEYMHPGPSLPPELSSIIPPIDDSKGMREKDPQGPLMTLPYPFTGYPAQTSSAEPVPFPPSPGRVANAGDEIEENIDVPEEVDDDEEDVEEEEEEEEEEGEGNKSSGRASGSMSSLGQPISSRYPFQFRTPMRGTSTPSSRNSHHTPHSVSTGGSRSTGNRESTSNGSSEPAHSPLSQMHTGIPMPPRAERRRSRAGTAPSLPASPVTPAAPGPRARPRARTRTESVGTDISATFGPTPVYESSGDEGDEDVEVQVEEDMEQPEAEGSQEMAEREDSVGLLSAAPSPKSSLAALRHRASNLSHRRGSSRSGSRSGSGSRANSQGSRSPPGSALGSVPASIRSRTQSLIQSIGAASRSSLELAMRSRAHSMARLSDSPYYSDAQSGSDPMPSSNENNTFGHPLRAEMTHQEPGGRSSGEREQGQQTEHQQHLTVPQTLHPSSSNISGIPPSERSERTISPERTSEGLDENASRPDISTAAQSFVTVPASVDDTETSRGTVSSWGGISQDTQGELRRHL